MAQGRESRYWRRNVRYLLVLLIAWFAVSFGAGILFVDVLDRVRIGGFGLGFWFSQQGAIVGFVVIVFVYVWLMNRLDREYEEGEAGDGEAGGGAGTGAGTGVGE